MKTSLFKKLIQQIVLILCIALILTLCLNYLYIKSKFYSNIEEDMNYTTKDIVEKMENDINHSEEKFFFLANSSEINRYNMEERPKNINDLLNNFKNEFPIVVILDTKTKNTFIEFNTLTSLKTEYEVIQEEMKNFIKLKDNPNKVMVSDIKYCKELRKSVVIFSYLKKSYFDEEIAAVYGLFIVDYLFENLTTNYNFKLIDSKNTVLLSSIPEEINTQYAKNKNLPYNKIDEITIENKEFFYFIKNSEFGKIFMSIDKDKLINEILEQLFMIFIIFLFVFIFSFVVIFIYSKKITLPINNLLLQIEEYKKGNFVDKIEISTNDEIELLSKSFEELGRNLFQNKKELLDINTHLEKKVEYEVKEKLKVSKLAMKSKDQFLASMSHEIRTPLNAILGFIEILKEDEIDIEKVKYLDTIDKSSKSLLGIINDILDFNKIENQMLTMELIAFSPEEEFSTVMKLFDFKASSNGITLVKRFDNLPPKLLGDPLRIKQVLGNLISNAIKFSPKNTEIEISLFYNNGYLRVNIKDEGKGISNKYQKNIFIPFTQEDSSNTRKYGGTGLGLSISYRLVRLMGGKLNVKSEVNVGSEFYFSIPLKQTTMNIEEENKLTIKKSFNAHILLAEDNLSNQIFMKILFKKLNVTFEVANDGVEAFEMFQKNKYDLILMDENMPNMSGTDATVKIIKYENENNIKHTPIISLTANALKGDKERFLSIGMDDYLSKPLKQSELSRIFLKYL